jgi:hypothetical protein
MNCATLAVSTEKVFSAVSHRLDNVMGSWRGILRRRSRGLDHFGGAWKSDEIQTDRQHNTTRRSWPSSKYTPLHTKLLSVILLLLLVYSILPSRSHSTPSPPFSEPPRITPVPSAINLPPCLSSKQEINSPPTSSSRMPHPPYCPLPSPVHYPNPP